MKNITIIGSGSFGCALAYILQNNNNVKIWSYTKEECNSINNKHECLFLPSIKLKEDIKCYTNYEEALDNSDIIFFVTPSSAIRKTCTEIKKYYKNQDIVIASKGMDNGKLLTEVVKEELNINASVISGPSHAEQIAKNIPTYVEFSGNKELVKDFEIDNFRINYNEDIIGIEVGAALKNVISLASGIIEGLNYESNTVSFIITEGLKEIKEIGIKLGAKESTFYGLSGLGDLITTTISLDSRNKRAGLLFAKGKKIEEIKREVGMTIEGLDSLNNAYLIIDKYKLDCPLITNLYNIIYNNKNIKDILKF